jgi:hypothetical protein
MMKIHLATSAPLLMSRDLANLVGWDAMTSFSFCAVEQQLLWFLRCLWQGWCSEGVGLEGEAQEAQCKVKKTTCCRCV